MRTGRPSLKDSVKNPLVELSCSSNSPQNSATHLVDELLTMKGYETRGKTKRGTRTRRPSFKGLLKSCLLS